MLYGRALFFFEWNPFMRSYQIVDQAIGVRTSHLVYWFRRITAFTAAERATTAGAIARGQKASAEEPYKQDPVNKNCDTPINERFRHGIPPWIFQVVEA